MSKKLKYKKKHVMRNLGKGHNYFAPGSFIMRDKRHRKPHDEKRKELTQE